MKNNTELNKVAQGQSLEKKIMFYYRKQPKIAKYDIREAKHCHEILCKNHD